MFKIHIEKIIYKKISKYFYKDIQNSNLIYYYKYTVLFRNRKWKTFM